MARSVAIVTGASQGIGQATAIRLARDFSALVLAARNRANLERTAEAVRAAGAEALIIDVDVAQPAASRTVVDQALQAFGRIDALLNIAGAVPQIDLFEMTDEQWEAGLALKLHGARRLTIAAWSALKAARARSYSCPAIQRFFQRRPTPRSAQSMRRSSPWPRPSPTAELKMASRSIACCRDRS